MSQGKRIRDLRKSLGMTLDNFGERIGLKKSAVSLIENDKNSVTDQVVKSICREFNVSEEWLRTGQGEMFKQLSQAELAARTVAKHCLRITNLFKAYLLHWEN